MGAELSKEMKSAIINGNLTACRQQIYDITINIEVNTIAGDAHAVEKLKTNLAMWMKKRDAFEQKLRELDAPAQ